MSKIWVIALAVLLTGLLLFYYFFPFRSVYFTVGERNSNFSLVEKQDMQFYPNMRFPSPNISYKISDCTLKKMNDAEFAFSIFENKTSLDFYPIEEGEDIFITCDEKLRYDGDYFVAGEGGPTEIINASNFNVILHGEVLLIEDSDCPNPNIAMHELLHVLGFKHSDNPMNIMYNITRCEQTISDDIILLLNELYAIPSYPDLVLKDVFISKKGSFLDINVSVMNYGLKNSEDFVVGIYSEGSLIKKLNFEGVDIGSGRAIFVKNVFTLQKLNEVEVVIETEFPEIDEKNKIKLEISD